MLAENDGLIEGQRVHQEVQARVTWAAEQVRVEQVPEYAPIRFAGHEAASSSSCRGRDAGARPDATATASAGRSGQPLTIDRNRQRTRKPLPRHRRQLRRAAGDAK